ncbi:hypothetical protein MNBD_GAMMA22-1268 [hydrothermal vent metagenome]|uniref:POTRA domain-containing protein n=1 Tax=hydrothermal vent metagenome TaxID=652676 RepID=A0A3B1A8U2_9ZZZZ
MDNFTKQMYLKKTILLLGLLSINTVIAAPQVDPSIIQENQDKQKIIEQEAQSRLENRPTIDSEKLIIKDISLLATGQCQLTKQIFTYGADVISQSKLNAIIQPYLNQCLDNKKITALVKNIQNWYLKAGYITTRTTIKKPQNSFTEKGNLELWVYEGLLGNFILNNNTAQDKSRIKTAFPVATGDVLNIHDLDQGLEQLNSLFSQKFKMQIKPSTRPGYSDIFLIELTRNTKKTQQLGLNYSNGGTKATGEDLYNLKYTKENLFNINDSTSLSIQKALPERNNKSESIRVSTRIPYGYWSFKLNYNSGNTLRTINSNTIAFRSISDNQTTQFSVNHVYSRSQKSKFELNSAIEFSDRKSFINDTLITVSSRQTASLNVGLLYTRYFNNSTLILSPSISKGGPLFGAIANTPNIKKNQAHAEYNMFKFYSYLRHQFLPHSRYQFTLQNSVNAQYSDQALYGEKQFVLGGEYSIRGFKENVMSSDNGISVRNDIILPIGQWLYPWLQKPVILPLNFKIHYDLGEGYPVVDGKRQSISGWGVGLEYNYKYLSLSYTVAAPIINPDVFQEKQNRISYLNLNLRYVF